MHYGLEEEKMTTPDTTGWGYYMQGNERTQEIEEWGAKLSTVLHCPVHYPAWGKRLFECHCSILFPLFVVQAAIDSDDWSAVVKQHEEGYKSE